MHRQLSPLAKPIDTLRKTLTLIDTSLDMISDDHAEIILSKMMQFNLDMKNECAIANIVE